MANRYSRLQQPSTVNPISFEEFARVPMARQQAEAEALRATQSIETDFDVDQKDLMSVSSATEAIDGEKSNLVDNILQSGVNNQTISEFINVKKLRDDKYKSFIDKAQTNKQGIDKWRAEVDRMQVPPQYKELIKNKEYSKWKGTLGDDGTTQDFVPNFGKQYINEDADIQNTMAKSGITTEELMTKGYRSKYDRNIGKFVIIDKEGKIVSGNAKQLQEAANLLLRDYSTEGTIRGDYAAYSGLDIEKLESKINDYLGVFNKSTEKTTTGYRFLNPNIPSGSGKKEASYKAPVFTDLEFTKSHWVQPKQAPGKTRSDSQVLRDVDTEVMKEYGLESGSVTNNPIQAYKSMKAILTKDPNKSWYGNIGDLYDRYKKSSIKHLNKRNDLKGTANYTKDHFDVVQQLISENKLTKSYVMDALKTKSLEGIRDINDKVEDYLIDNSKAKFEPKINSSHYILSNFGEKTKASRTSYATDVADRIHTIELVRRDSREKVDVDDDTRTKLAKGLRNGSVGIKGTLSVNSPLLLDEEGNYIPKISRGDVLVDEDGTEYIAEPIWASNADMETNVGRQMRKGTIFESYLLSTPYGEKRDLIFTNPETNESQVVQYYVDPTGPVEHRNKQKVLLNNGTEIPFEDIYPYLELPSIKTN